MDLRSPSSVAPGPGTRVGNYVLRDKIGQGGFAEVWTAVHHERPDRAPVAVKIATDPQFRRQLAAEGRLPDIPHPNVVPILDSDTRFAELPYIVMPYYAGGSLADEISAHAEGLPEQRVEAVLYDLLAGLAAAHQLSIVHRDIKPQNILMAENRVAVVADFGVSVHSGAAPMMQSVMQSASMSIEAGRTLAGTLAYMPPEVLEGRPATPAADVYAVGILLFEMLVGRRPAGLELPSGARASLRAPEYWDELFSACCRPLARRYCDAAAMRAALKGRFVAPAAAVPTNPADAAEQLRDAVRIALADGVATVGEVSALEHLSDRLRVSDEDRREILSGIRSCALTAFSPAAVWRRALDTVLAEGVVSASLVARFGELAKTLNVPLSDRENALTRARGLVVDVGTPLEQLQRAVDVVLADGVCTKAELGALEALARTLRLHEGQIGLALGDVRGGVAAATDHERVSYTESVAAALHACADGKRIHAGGAVPPNAMARARQRCGIPAGERVLGLVDMTIHGGGHNGILFGDRAMYYHNATSGPAPGSGLIGYVEFPYIAFLEHQSADGRWRFISAGAGRIVTISGDLTTAAVQRVLCAIQAAIRGVHAETTIRRDVSSISNPANAEASLSERPGRLAPASPGPRSP